MACDPALLLEQAKCITTCIPPGMMPAVNMTLLCQIVDAGGGGGGGGGVTSFNARTGAVTLELGDITPLVDSRYVLKSGDTMTGALDISNGVLVATDPALDLIQTWNNAGVAFTALRTNVTDTASATASFLMDLQVGGASRFNIRKDGTVSTAKNGTSTDVAFAFGGRGTGLNYGLFTTGVGDIGLTVGGANGLFSFTSAGAFSLSGSTPQLVYGADIALIRDAAGILGQRQTTTAQAFRIYNTFTTAVTNFERLDLQWVANVCQIWTEKGTVTGTARPLVLGCDATELMRFGSATTLSFFAQTAVVRQTGPALNITNNVTAGGTDGTIANYTDLTIYANDAAAIRNDIHQLARGLKFASDALRAYGLLT